MATRSRYTNPIENLRSYVMVHHGIDWQERQSDIEWVESKIEAAEKLASMVKTTQSLSDTRLAELQRLARALTEL